MRGMCEFRILFIFFVQCFRFQLNVDCTAAFGVSENGACARAFVYALCYALNVCSGARKQ